MSQNIDDLIIHADYPHHPGTLYDCPACEVILAERESCQHSWVAGMMYVHPEDCASVSQMRDVTCEKCDVTWSEEIDNVD